MFRAVFLLLCVICTAISFANHGLDQDSLPAKEAIFEEKPSDNQAQFQIFANQTGVVPGKPFTIAIHMKIEKGWHSYWKNPGETGMPLQLEWQLPDGFQAKELQWPRPQRFDQEGLVGYGYENESTFLTEIIPPAHLSQKEVSLKASIQALVCSDMMCLPVDHETALQLPILKESSPTHVQLFEKAQALLPKDNPHFSAKYSDGLIEVHGEALKHAKNVTFFPAESNTVDEKEKPVLSEGSVLLKKADAFEGTILQGVLVVDKEGSKQAWNLNLPLKGESSSSAIGLADSPKETPVVTYLPDSHFDGGIAWAFIFAFMGGILLNFMPCVLPVISLKILSFVKMARKNRKLIFQHGLAFSLGVLISFWILAGAMLLLQSYGHAIGWGFQLQEPLFVGLLSALLLLLSLSFFGVFEFGTSLTAIAGQVQETSKSQNNALRNSLFSGMLATAVATPCSGPFLGSAIGFAVTLPAWVALAIFTVLGLGMAFPYLLLSAFPSLLRFLPKPGPWMETFKQSMGFAMLATVLWLLWVFAAQTVDIGLFGLLASLLVLSLAAWIYGRFCTPVKSKFSRWLGALVALTLTTTSIGGIVTASSSVFEDVSSHEAVAAGDWEPFSQARVDQLQQQGIPVFIDFTAKWCLICQVNHAVLSTGEVKDQFERHHVVKMKADWTRRDASITEALAKYGRNAVPLYVLTSGDPSKESQILPQVLTPQIVNDSLKQL